MNNKEISLFAAELADQIIARAQNEEEYEKILKLISALLGANCSCVSMFPPSQGIKKTMRR